MAITASTNQSQQGHVPVGSIKLDQTKEEIARVFKCTISNCGYIFKNGKRAIFTPGKDGKPFYATRIRGEIEALDEEVENGHLHIYIDKNEETVGVIEPFEALRQRIIDEYLVQQARAVNQNNDAGNYEQGKLNTANSRTIAAAAASGLSPAAAPAATATK